MTEARGALNFPLSNCRTAERSSGRTVSEVSFTTFAEARLLHAYAPLDRFSAASGKG